MDKTRDVKRGASRFSIKKQKRKRNKHSSGFDNGIFVSLEKSRKEKLQRLSSVVDRSSSSNEERERVCDLVVSDKDNELNPPAQTMSNAGISKRFKLPKKFFDDQNGVDHASVPRKLRSAMKKRNRQSVSPPFPDIKKLNQTIFRVESPKKDGVKKPKLNIKQGGLDWSLKQNVCGLITKDEEEVVETLYALAGMFPDNDITFKNKLDDSLEENPPALPEVKRNPSPAFEECDLKSVCTLKTADAAPPSNVERSPNETVEVDHPLKESCVGKLPHFPDSEKIHLESNSSVPQVNLQSVISSLVKSEPSEKEFLCNSVNPCVLPQPSLDSGTLKQPMQLETPPLEIKPEIAFGARVIESQLEQHKTKDSKINGLALWPGLSSTVSFGAGSHGPSPLSLAPKLPAWLDAALCSSTPCSLETSTSTGKVSKCKIDRKSMKRCVAHVYISRLIRVLQMPESKDAHHLQPSQLTPHEESRQGILMMVNDLNWVRNGLHGVMSGSSINSTTAEKNLKEATKGILQHTRVQQDRPQAATASGLHTSQKQSFDFLSLSAGGGGGEAFRNVSRTGNGLEPLSQFQVPYLHSRSQHHALMSLCIPQTHYAPSAYQDQHSAAAAQQVVPPYLGSSLCTRRTSYTLTKQERQLQEQQQQQQHRIWAAHIALPNRVTGASTAITQFSNWQNGRQGSQPLVPCSQTIVPASPPSSLEVLGPHYTPISHQQQHPMAFHPPHWVKRHDCHLPSVFEETGVGLCAGGALPLQLLCNERL
ncbi:hypothetical protein CFOL_v3_07134 [Cephalotus follicularis]|uniref:Uncharacterized protein n=1 Tax=Cephalotus follicularis TaxID=3775 RepID=A0A1Q3B6G3_CEPFO|nr:hypothetical protein CFOL_v3_07134 [Cephalotus follicularis]